MSPQFGFAIEYVSDIEGATRFYTDVIGLEVERKHPTYVQFQNFAIASDEPLGGVKERELYWLVEDAEKAFAALPKSAEVTLPLRQMPLRQGVRRQGANGEPLLPAGAVAGPAERGRLAMVEE